MTRERGRSRTIGGLFAWAILLAVVLPLSLFAMAPALDGIFLNWDDDVYVTGNPMIADLSPSGIGAFFSTLHAGHWFPMVLLSYGIDYRLGGLDPAVFHRTNLLLHLAAVVSVFLFTLLLTGSRPAALFCALLFGIHPAHAESVTWIAERKDLLSAPFFFLSLAAWLSWLGNRRRPFYLLSLVLFAASLGAKAMAMTLPVVLLLIDRERGRKVSAATLLEKAPFFLLAMGSAIVTLTARSRYVVELREHPYRLADIPVSLYRAALVHLGEIVLPSGLFPVLPGRAAHLPAGVTPGLLIWAGAAAAAILSAVVLLAAWRRLPWAFGPLFFAVTLSPVLAITAPGYFADRYTYIPSVGIFLVAAHLAGRIWNAGGRWRPARHLLMAIAAALLVLLPIQARGRARAWAEGVPLWTRAIAIYPGTGDAYFLRGELLAARGDHRGAVSDFDSAERTGYMTGALFEARALSLVALGEDGAALRDLDTVIGMRPDHLPALRDRDRIRAGMRDPEGAATDDTSRSGGGTSR